MVFYIVISIMKYYLNLLVLKNIWKFIKCCEKLYNLFYKKYVWSLAYVGCSHGTTCFADDGPGIRVVTTLLRILSHETTLPVPSQKPPWDMQNYLHFLGVCSSLSSLSKTNITQCNWMFWIFFPILSPNLVFHFEKTIYVSIPCA